MTDCNGANILGTNLFGINRPSFHNGIIDASLYNNDTINSSMYTSSNQIQKRTLESGSIHPD